MLAEIALPSARSSWPLTVRSVAIQFRGKDSAIRFNNWVTASKAVGLVVIIAAAALIGQGDLAHFDYIAPRYEELSTTGLFAALGTSLIFVMFCYTGWNAAAYVASEIVEPQRILPRSLLTGTAIAVDGGYSIQG